MEYLVRFIGDHQLPEGVDWAFMRCESETVCFIKRSRVCPAVLSEAWVAWERLRARDLRECADLPARERTFQRL